MKLRGVKECKGIYGLSRMALVNYEKKGPIKPLTEKKSESNFVTKDGNLEKHERINADCSTVKVELPASSRDGFLGSP